MGKLTKPVAVRLGRVICARSMARSAGLAIAGLCVLAAPAVAQEGAKPDEIKKAEIFVKETLGAAQAADDSAVYQVSQFKLDYGTKEGADRPDLSEPAFQNLTISLSKNSQGVYTEPREGSPSETIKLSDITPQSPGNFSRSGIIEVCRGVVREFNRRGIYALFVAPSAEDIDERGWADRSNARPDDKRKGTGLTIVVWTGVVRAVRTVGGGERELEGSKLNHPAHALTLRNSPINPGDLLRKDKLDEYTFALNRHPGRRVDAAVGAADEAGGVQVDYLVTENKPWTAYFQISNTGTKNTSEWRERFGFVHNQLTNHDDTLRLEYATAGFDSSHAVIPSYEFPLLTNVLRAKVYGSWSEFTASDVGREKDQFKGRSWTAGGELAWTVAQFSNTFIDLVGGIRYEHISIDNIKIVQDRRTTASEDFFLPYAGARVQRDTDASHSSAEVMFETVANDGDSNEVNLLGRAGAGTRWEVLHFDAEHSFYVEPLFDPRDPKDMTLAHEVSVSARGQYAFNNKLIPTAQGVAGGFYSVRGYPESVVAGDSTLVASLEYRFHLPQVLSQSSAPDTLLGQEFRYTPQGPYGRADWDLIFKGFLDYGHTTISARETAESNADLLSAGIGAELQLLRNVNVRVDWGLALKDVNTNSNSGGERVDSGDSRVHFSLTLSF